MAAPAAGQKRAETTAKISKATRLSSPPVSPNMRHRVPHAAFPRKWALATAAGPPFQRA